MRVVGERGGWWWWLTVGVRVCVGARASISGPTTRVDARYGGRLMVSETDGRAVKLLPVERDP